MEDASGITRSLDSMINGVMSSGDCNTVEAAIATDIRSGNYEPVLTVHHEAPTYKQRLHRFEIE
jgi:hypothetical protein